MRLAAAATGLSMCLLLHACSGSDLTPIPNYLTRLSRTLDLPIEPAPPVWPPLPRARALQVDVLPGSLDLLDLLSLGDCQLNVTIGKSNSSLGKLASASQRLLLELEFLSLAPACIRHLERSGDTELAATLESALVDKRRQLPGRLWNATLGGPEFRSFWQRNDALKDYPRSTGGAVPAALEELAALIEAWQAGNFDVGIERLETLLDVVRRGDGGSLLTALAIQRQGLSSATDAVRKRVAGPALCFSGSPSPEGRIFETVVRKFFIGEVQPWAVDLARRRRQLGDPLGELEQALASVVPPAYRHWLRQRDALLQSSAEAPKKHALAVAELLDTCGLRPGAPR